MIWLSNTLDLAVKQGLDYEVPQELNRLLRGATFTGCSGFLTFESDTNDRSFSGLRMYEHIYD
jgi:hypothetical protein